MTLAQEAHAMVRKLVRFRVRLPAMFGHDHLDRFDDTAHYGIHHETVFATKQHLTVEFDRAGINNLIADAEYYASPYGPGAGDRAYIGLRASARATLKAIERHYPEVYAKQMARIRASERH